MARGFLWVVAVLTLLVVAGAIVWRLFAPDLLRTAFVPATAFEASAAPPAPDYAARASWIAHPDLPGNPALWTPPGYRPAPRPAAAVFFVSPTAWLDRSRWNAPLDDSATNERLDRFTRQQASVFNGVAEVWVPRYRQATFGSFLRPGPDADRALALAYSDVLRAFDAFLAAQPTDRPLIVAGHSQGSRHILHLLRDRRTELAGRLVAAYPVGWAVTEADLAAVGLPACAVPGEIACLATWQSFAADGDLRQALEGFAQVRDIGGTPIGQRAMLCLNPLSGSRATAAPERNAGMLVENALRPRAVGAACDPRGLLLISPTPDPGPYVLPGGNFHVYDYGLFWANVRADVEARLSSYGAARLGGEPLPAGTT